MIELNILWQSVLSARAAKTRADSAYGKAVDNYARGVKTEVERLKALGVDCGENVSQLSPLDEFLARPALLARQAE